MRRAYFDFYESLGMKDIPPGVALAIVVGAYAAPRLVQPEPVGKLKAFGQKIVGGLKGLAKR
jgi:hypothetical protein